MARGKANLHKSKSNDDLYKEMGTVKPPKNIDKKINPLKKKKSNRSLLKSSKSSK